ncbi:MAG: M48 family metalloprotease [Candidatus Methanomethylophilaceae archaeon]|nr:M48 family metalloprotease [Candidatus Methanomethylophilaceae archaeon]
MAAWHARTALMFVAMTGILVALGSVIGYIFNYTWTGFYIMLGVSLLITFVSYFFSKKMALAANKVHLITREEEPRLYNTVEKLAKKAGLPMPEVGVSEVPMPNAFATGRSPKDAAVVATRPLLHLLNDEELEGVLAHELSHVKNRDILVMSFASAMASIISFVTRMAVWSAIFSGNNRDGASLAIAILADLTLPFAAMLVQLGISRNREYLADESGARLTGKPMALASALTSLERGCSSNQNTYDNPSCANMWISDPYGKKRSLSFSGLFRTHPSTEDRVARLKKLDEELNGTHHFY